MISLFQWLIEFRFTVHSNMCFSPKVVAFMGLYFSVQNYCLSKSNNYVCTENALKKLVHVWVITGLPTNSWRHLSNRSNYVRDLLFVRWLLHWPIIWNVTLTVYYRFESKRIRSDVAVKPTCVSVSACSICASVWIPFQHLLWYLVFH